MFCKLSVLVLLSIGNITIPVEFMNNISKLDTLKVNDTLAKVATSQARSIPNLIDPIISMLEIFDSINVTPDLIFFTTSLISI